MNYNRLYTILILALAATSCIQDPESPKNLPDAPVLSVDETAVTRVSMVVNGTFGKDMTDITQYGVEISETLFDAGGTYKTLVPQEMGADGFSLGVTGLTLNQTYFLRAFISNGHSKMYSPTITQQTPETSVASISDVTVRDNFLVATIEDNGGRSIEEVGFMWGTSSERKDLKREKRYPGTMSADGKTFTLPLAEVGQGTHYVLAYAEDDRDGTGYSRIPYEMTVEEKAGLQAVDLGLSVKWANMNLGANAPEEVGLYYSWGEIETKTNYDWSTYKWCEGSETSMKKYNTSGNYGTVDYLVELEEADDVAHQALKGQWRIPTYAEFEELVNTKGNQEYRWTYKKMGNVNGWEICWLVNGETVFLPSTGFYSRTFLSSDVSNSTILWTSTLYTEKPYHAWRFYFEEVDEQSIVGMSFAPKRIGCPIRAVYGAKKAVPVTGVEFVQKELQLKVGESLNLEYSVLPFNATNQRIDFTSADSSIASLSGQQLTALSVGTTTITITTVDGEYSATCIVTVYDDISASKYLTFISEGTTTVTFGYNEDYAPLLFYSTDAKNWNEWNYRRNRLTFSNGSPLYICGDNPEGFSYGPSNFHSFYAEGDKFAVSGDIMSLIDKSEDVTVIPRSYCFFHLFGDCDLLTAAPSMSATTLAEYCYDAMFVYCSNLVSGPEVLPATSLAPNCYYSMFYGCTSLTAAPELPAGTLVDNCYTQMFYGCSSLSYIKCLATDISATYCTLNWTTNVSSLGIFVKAPEMTGWSRGTDAIPGGWVVLDDGAESISASRYLTFTSEGTTSISLSTHSKTPVLYYSIDKTNWSIWDFSEITLTKDVPLYICGDNPNGIGSDESHYCNFVATGDKFSISGDIMSLINKDEALLEIPSKYCFYSLFYQCGLLSSAPELPATILTPYCYNRLFMGCSSLTSTPVLPAMNLESRCYMSMFYDCTSLTEAPELPATDMATACYADMFSGCTSLTKAPVLSSTSLAEYCYAWMFYGCTNLTDAPELPATTVRSNCYYIMFGDCTSLTTAPVLPASKLSDSSYAGMFSGCSNLSYLECLATDISASSCVSSWLMNVSSTGTFVKSAQMTAWPTGASGIPSGWTVEDAQ